MIQDYESFPVIYCLRNNGQPGLVKIGYTADLRRRLQQLNASTGLAYPFEVCFVYETNQENADKFLHSIIDLLNPDLRVRVSHNGGVRTREFFRLSESQAYYLFEQIALMTDTEEKLHKTTPTGGYWDGREDSSGFLLFEPYEE